MRLELRRVAPVRAANVVALLYAFSMLIFALPMFMMLSLIPNPALEGAQQPTLSFSAFRWLVIMYPILGLVFGWFTGLVGAFLYNAIATRLGGFDLEFLSDAAPPQSRAV